MMIKIIRSYINNKMEPELSLTLVKLTEKIQLHLTLLENRAKTLCVNNLPSIIKNYNQFAAKIITGFIYTPQD